MVARAAGLFLVDGAVVTGLREVRSDAEFLFYEACFEVRSQLSYDIKFYAAIGHDGRHRVGHEAVGDVLI